MKMIFSGTVARMFLLFVSSLLFLNGEVVGALEARETKCTQGLFQGHQQSLEYLSQITSVRKKWIETNKREVDSFQHYLQDLKKVRVILARAKIDFENLDPCLLQERKIQNVSARYPETHADKEQQQLESIRSLSEKLQLLRQETRFLRVYDSRWAQKLETRFEALERDLQQAAVRLKQQRKSLESTEQFLI